MHRKCLCPYLCQSMSVCVTIYRDHVWLSSLPVSIKVLSHKVTCHSDMSQRQNRIHVTRGDLMPWQSSIILFPGSAVSGKAHNWFIYRLVTATCRKCMWLSHKGTFWLTCRMNFQTDLNSCNKSRRRIASKQRVTWGLVAGMCRGDRSPRVTGPLVSFRII